MIVLGVIPARGGSKEVPLKNIKQLCGRPLIAYTIESAQKASSLSYLVVSTDNKEISDVALGLGCQVIMRPQKFATDSSPTEDALVHAIEELKRQNGFEADVVLTLEPTSPFRRTETIDACIEMFKDRNVDSVIAVVETRSCYGKIVNKKFEFLFPNQPRRRQERKPLYKESSTIYGTRKDTLLKTSSVIGGSLCPLIVSQIEAFDINTELDFLIAERLMELKIKGELK